jgi:hypothetical protein
MDGFSFHDSGHVRRGPPATDDELGPGSRKDSPIIGAGEPYDHERRDRSRHFEQRPIAATDHRQVATAEDARAVPQLFALGR